MITTILDRANAKVPADSASPEAEAWLLDLHREFARHGAEDLFLRAKMAAVGPLATEGAARGVIEYKIAEVRRIYADEGMTDPDFLARADAIIEGGFMERLAELAAQCDHGEGTA